MLSSLPKVNRVRSFVGRNSRITPGQTRAFQTSWPELGLSIKDGCLNLAQVFSREAPCHLEIGFGHGQSLFALANLERDKNFIGIETHRPGIGAICLAAQDAQLTNLKLFNADAVEVLETAIPDSSLDCVQIFFPDPWPKRRHHIRRLVQPEFIQLVIKKLKSGGEIHLATDWAEYAEQMLLVLSSDAQLVNLAGPHSFSPRSQNRPVLTKFERRAIREGRSIWDLQFRVC